MRRWDQKKNMEAHTRKLKQVKPSVNTHKYDSALIRSFNKRTPSDRKTGKANSSTYLRSNSTSSRTNFKLTPEQDDSKTVVESPLFKLLKAFNLQQYAKVSLN